MARQIAVIIAILLTIAVNGLANSLPIGGRTTGEVSAAYPVLFTPAGYAFSIWGLIYIALLVYAVAQAAPSRRRDPDQKAIGWLFIGTCLFNVLWILAWHNLLIPLSLVFMLGLLLCLILIYLRLEKAKSSLTGIDYWTLRFPFSLYLGWITVATVASVTIALYAAGWRGGPIPEPLWAVIAIIAALAIGLTGAWRSRDAVFSLVFVWAFAAIAVGQSEHRLVAGAAAGAAALQAIGTVATLLVGRRAKTRSSH